MEPVPPFRGIRKVADSQRESTGNSRTFDILRAGGGLVGSVTGTDIDKVKSYVAQAKSG
jgi:hypothetical protein